MQAIEQDIFDEEMIQELEQEALHDPEFDATMIEEVPTEAIEVGPVSINYGNIWLDALAGFLVLAALIAGYYWKKRIDKKFKD